MPENDSQVDVYIHNVRYFLKQAFGCNPDHMWAETDGWVMAQLNDYDSGLANALQSWRDLYVLELHIEEFPTSNGRIGMLIRIWVKENMPLFYRIVYSLPLVRDVARNL